MARGSPSASPPSSPSNSLDLSHPGVRFRVSPRLASGVIPEVLRARAGWFEVDDVEFFFAPGDRSRVEYRTAGRVDKAPSASETQRKRIKALRIALQKKGCKGIGF